MHTFTPTAESTTRGDSQLIVRVGWLAQEHLDTQTGIELVTWLPLFLLPF